MLEDCHARSDRVLPREVIEYCHAPTMYCLVLSPAMPPKPTRSSGHTDDSGELIALRIIELLNDDALGCKVEKSSVPM